MTISNQVVAAFGKGRFIILWALSVLTALVFLVAGFPKLTGAPEMVEIFDKIGFGQWFRYFTGIWEVLSAICLLIPRYAFYGASALAVVVIGAIIAQSTMLEHSLNAPAVLLAVTAGIAYLRRTTDGSQVRG